MRNSIGLELAVTLKGISSDSRLPPGTKSVSVFLVNKRKPDEEHYYKSFVFQAKLAVECAEGFASRPDPRGLGEVSTIDEWDERVGNLHYRDVHEFAVGLGVATVAHETQPGVCRKISTTWIPHAEVERVSPNEKISSEFRIEELALLQNGADAAAKLSPLIEQYDQWISIQEGKKWGLSKANEETTEEMLKHARIAADRIRNGIEQLNDPVVLEAFRIANRAMAAAGRQRQLIQAQGDSTKVQAPVWRPFQLAFILLTLRGIVDPSHSDRECVDLLFFPTGGGKTEAYLGLAAFTLVLRRLRNPGINSAGVTVLMRYTLRLLTLDQLGRAAALICALELERDRNPALGKWPFEIGLWVGSAATPNIMGYKGYDGPGKEKSARAKTIAYKGDDKKPAPIPIEECPWCGEKFTRDSFFLTPNPDKPTNLSVKCVNYKCEFSKDRSLPILGVDEAIYRRLPGFLIATVDGQPKTSAEYIQASSRVGRIPDRPGLVVTLFNIHRPRDRSHFERFATYHATFYRSVEATSVTPFSPRALDRALAAALVALCRHAMAQMTPALGAMKISTLRADLDSAAQRFAARAREHKQLSAAEGQALYDHVLGRCNELLDDWLKIQQEFESKSTRLVYNPSEAGGAQRLLYEPLNPDLTTIEPIRRRFRANRSMRDVETSVELETVNLHEWGTK